MKLKTYIKNLQKLIKENPDALGYDVVYSKDDEGNGFQKVQFDPSIGEFSGREFDQEEDGDEWLQEHSRNAICIN